MAEMECGEAVTVSLSCIIFIERGASQQYVIAPSTFKWCDGWYRDALPA